MPSPRILLIKRSSGFTLVELLVVLAISSFLISLAISDLSYYQRLLRSQEAVNEVTAALRARSNALLHLP